MGMHTELQEIVGESRPRTPPEEDGLVVLRQLPAPLYALDTLHAVLTIMARSVVLADPEDRNEFLNIVSNDSQGLNEAVTSEFVSGLSSQSSRTPTLSA